MYESTVDEITQVQKAFTYHAPFGDQPERYQHLREQARDLALGIIASCPPSRERSLALTNLQQDIQWANASIAVNEAPDKE